MHMTLTMLLLLLTATLGTGQPPDDECDSDVLQECLTNSWGERMHEITSAAVIDCGALHDHWSTALRCFAIEDPACCASMLTSFDGPDAAPFVSQCPNFASGLQGECSAVAATAGTHII